MTTKELYEKAVKESNFTGTYEEFIEGNPSVDFNEAELILEDAGMQARDRMLKKSSKFGFIKNTGIFLLTTLVLTLAGLGVYVNQTMVKTFEHYQRECSLPEEAKIDIGATRIYRYQVIKVLGFTIRMDGNESIETNLKSTFNETTITGIKGETWFSVYIPKGEPTQHRLKEADTYVISQGKQSWVIDTISFCK